MGGKISKPYIVAIDKGVQDTMTSGAIAGYPVQDVKVAVYDGSMHAVDSNEMAFKTAARIGFRAAAEKADAVILEPMATLEITVPDAYAGAVMGDISSIRGRVLGMDAPDAGVQLIKAQAPYAEVVHYSPHLRALSQRHGQLHYRDHGVRAGPRRRPEEARRRVPEGARRGALASSLAASNERPVPRGPGLFSCGDMAPSAGFEPAAFCSGGRRSIH